MGSIRRIAMVAALVAAFLLPPSAAHAEVICVRVLSKTLVCVY